MTRKIIQSALAESDLFDLWDYIAHDSPAAADRLIDRIHAACVTLAAHPRAGPRAGRERPELGEGIRSYPVKNYVIYYCPLPITEGIEVMRVLSGRLDIEPDDMA